MLQHGAYTLLLDACYDREKFPTELEAIEWTWASTPEEEQAVRFVLSRFFELQSDGAYLQTRVYEEVQAYKIGEIQNRLIALAREAKKQNRADFASQCDDLRAKIKNDPLQKTHEAWTHVVDELVNQHERAPNHKPLTTNQEPRTNINNSADAEDNPEPDDPEPTPPRAKNTKSLDYSNWPAVPSEEVFADFKKLRQTKRAPITQTVIDKMATELKALERYGVTVDQALAIACERGWQGIKCEWVLNHLNLGGGNATGQLAGVTGPGVRKVSHSDQTRADAREALERLNGSLGDPAVRSTG